MLPCRNIVLYVFFNDFRAQIGEREKRCGLETRQVQLEI
jgi:hypothetical protein